MQAQHYFLKSERLGFRVWETDDLELAVNLWGDFRVTKLFDSRGALSKAQVLDRLHREIETDQKFGVQYWPVFNLISGEHIGACGLRPYQTAEKVFEIGFHICADQWGYGYATEAALAVMRYAFEMLKLNALFAGHNPKNEASRHLLLKLGFRYTHDEFYPPTGLHHPSYLFSREDFRING